MFDGDKSGFVRECDKGSLLILPKSDPKCDV